jgi:hypothetical protein
LPAFPGDRIASPRAAWSNVPGHPPGNGPGPQGAQSAGPISKGPLLKPLSCACATIGQPRTTSPAWRKHLARGKPCLAWPTSWPVPSMPCANATSLSIGSPACRDTGGARRSLMPHWTTRGRPSKLLGRRALTRLCTRRPAAREPQDVCGAATSGLRHHMASKSEHDTVC